jgi:erythromycin esterase-like protein
LIEAKQCFAVMLEADMPPRAGLHRFVNGGNMTIMEAMQPFAHRFPS